MAIKNKKELATKSVTDLEKKLLTLRTGLKDLRFKAAASELKNVRELRNTKREIACVLTLLKQAKK